MSFDFKADSHWDAYPAGLKVLAVDDDPLCLKVVAEMLKRCNYEVITAENGKEALLTLRDKSSQIDLVLSDVYMPDMDGFKLLETVGLELELPVIMMSSNGDTPVVLRGVTHGAVDFLIKPVRIEELRNVWQHVVRRRRDQAQTSREYSGDDEVVDGNRADKKRKESPTQVQHEGDDNASTKKPRVVWSVEMHQQFVNAVNSLGIDKAVPKRILDQMQVEGLTRENVASHLQKYRLYLKRVAGVQVQASGRGKVARNAGGDSHASFPPMMLPGHGMGGAQGLSMGSPMGSLSDQEQLKLQLQMQQMRNQQAIGAQPPYCKQEGPMLATGVVPPYPAGNGIANGLPGPDYSQLRPTGSYCNGGAPSRPAGAPGLMAMRSGSYDNGSLGLPHQAYNVAGITPLTSNDLMYPDHQLMHQQQHHSSLGGLRDLNLSHDLHHTGSLQQQPTDLGSADANGHTEQDMEKFINIFLQPND